jgi:hypothetical protein
MLKDLTDFLKGPFLYTSEFPVRTKISFVSIVNDGINKLEQSLSSIEAIAEELGLDHEIILCVKPGSVRSSMIYLDIPSKYENVEIIKSAGNIGVDYAQLIKNSTGNYIITFDSSTRYSIELADTISLFLTAHEKKAVFASMLIIPRRLIDEVGGWKGLRKCSEIDILGRIGLNFGITVLPSAATFIPESFLFSSLAMDNSMYHSKLSTIIPTIDNVLLYRDSIIGCNFHFRDLLLRIKLEVFPRKIILGFTLMIAQLLRILGEQPNKRSSQNRYIQFVEALIESIIFKEYEKYQDPGNSSKIYLNPGDLEYVKRRSTLWTKVNFTAYLSKTDEISMESQNTWR